MEFSSGRNYNFEEKGLNRLVGYDMEIVSDLFCDSIGSGIRSRPSEKGQRGHVS